MVTWVDAFRGVTEGKIRALPQSRGLGERRTTDLLRHARIDRRLEDDNGTRSQRAADRPAGAQQRSKIRTPVVVDRRRYRHHEERRARKIPRITREADRGDRKSKRLNTSH